MKEMARYGFILALICMLAAGLLAGVNAMTKTRILKQAQAEEEASRIEVMPDAVNFLAVQKEAEVIYYQALDKDDKQVGLVFKAKAKGYSSIIETLVGMRDDGTITAIKVVSQNETPGLGTRVTKPDFSARFANKNIKNFNEVQAITSATVSSSAVIKSVKAKAEEIKKLLDYGK